MKKIYILSTLMIAGISGFAQSSMESPMNFVSKQKTVAIPHSPAQVQTPGDTLYLEQFFNSLSTPNTLGIYQNIGGGYIFGTSVIGGGPGLAETAQGFILSEPVSVEEALFIFAAKDWVSQSATSKMVVKLYKLNGQATGGTLPNMTTMIQGPGTAIAGATADLLMSDVDTVGFTAVSFSSPVYITEDFGIAINVSNLYTNGDTVGLYSSVAGDAQDANLAFSKNGPTWYSTNTAYGNALDVDIAIFAVISDNVGMEEQGFFNGMKLSQNQPNPSNGNTVIQYELEKYSTSVELEIFDIHGRKAVVVSEGEKAAGRHSINIDTKLAAGTYYYSVIANGNRITKKMVVN